jgi:DNA repair protein RecO (recombination protein O)
MFTYSDFVLAEGRGFFSVAQADVIESFYNLRTDYDRLCAAQTVADILTQHVLEGNADNILRLALKSLSHLAKGSFPPKQILGVFFMRFFDCYGLRPNLPAGEMCEIFWGAEGIERQDGSSVTKNVTEKPSPQSFPLSLAAAAAISHILNNELSQAFQFEAHESVLEEIEKAARLFLREHFEPFASVK